LPQFFHAPTGKPDFRKTQSGGTELGAQKDSARWVGLAALRQGPSAFSGRNASACTRRELPGFGAWRVRAAGRGAGRRSARAPPGGSAGQPSTGPALPSATKNNPIKQACSLFRAMA